MNKPELENRAGLYNLLHAFHTYPLTEALLETLLDLVVDADSPLGGIAKMQSRLRGEPSLKDAAERLNVEMTRLFEGPGLPIAPPYASYYLNDKQLMGPPAVEARQFYLQWRAFPDSEIRLPDDHIALELGFLAHLAQQAFRAENETDRLALLSASREFIQNHLKPWLPSFTAAQAKAEVDAFFIGLTRLLQEVVEADLVWLDTVVENPQEILS